MHEHPYASLTPRRNFWRIRWIRHPTSRVAHGFPILSRSARVGLRRIHHPGHKHLCAQAPSCDSFWRCFRAGTHQHRWVPSPPVPRVPVFTPLTPLASLPTPSYQDIKPHAYAPTCHPSPKAVALSRLRRCVLRFHRRRPHSACRTNPLLNRSPHSRVTRRCLQLLLGPPNQGIACLRGHKLRCPANFRPRPRGILLLCSTVGRGMLGQYRRSFSPLAVLYTRRSLPLAPIQGMTRQGTPLLSLIPRCDRPLDISASGPIASPSRFAFDPLAPHNTSRMSSWPSGQHTIQLAVQSLHPSASHHAMFCFVHSACQGLQGRAISRRPPAPPSS